MELPDRCRFFDSLKVTDKSIMYTVAADIIRSRKLRKFFNP